MRSYRRLALSLALLAGLTLAAHAGTPGVKDTAGFFKDAAAVEKAEAQARELKQRYHKDVLVETFAEIPGGDGDRVSKMGANDKNRFFEDWADSRMKATGVHDVYVLI